MDQEKEFYKELDKSHRVKKDKTLSAWSLTLFFIVLIAVCEGVVFYLGKNLKVKPDEELTRSSNIQGELSLVSEPDFESNQPIYVPEGLLCSALASNLGSDVKCSITPEAIQIGGKISGLLPANATAFFVPIVEKEQAKLVLSDIKIGKISTFKFLGAPLNPIINKALKSSVSKQNIRIRKIDLDTGIMVILVDKI
jgi:hypothetical protein